MHMFYTHTHFFQNLFYVLLHRTNDEIEIGDENLGLDAIDVSEA